MLLYNTWTRGLQYDRFRDAINDVNRGQYQQYEHDHRANDIHNAGI